MIEAIIYSLSVILVLVWSRASAISADSKWQKKLRLVEEQLKKANTPVLYNNYPEFDEQVPLGLVSGHITRQLDEPSDHGLKKLYEALLEDNDNVSKLTVFLDTEYGTFVRTLEKDAFRDVKVDDLSAHVHTKWAPIHCGKACTVNGYIVFQDSILKYFASDIGMRPGDVLNLSYTLNPKDV
jgi:hypothetical protein